MLNNIEFLDFSNINNEKGILSYIDITPFEIKRIYYIYNVPKNMCHGEHAHKTLKQIFIPLCGTFDIFLDNGYEQKTYLLHSPLQGLYIKPILWRKLLNFSENAVCLVLASEHYDESDYIRNYEEFLNKIKGENR